MSKKKISPREECASSFEESLKELEKVVAELESGKLGLSDALTRYEEGVQRNMYRFYADMMKAAPGEWPSFEMNAERSTALRKDVDAKAVPVAAEAIEK